MLTHQGHYFHNIIIYLIYFTLPNCHKIHYIIDIFVYFYLWNSLPIRSHAIFTVWLKVVHTDHKGVPHIKKAKLNLVDLAGSERHGKTGKCYMYIVLLSPLIRILLKRNIIEYIMVNENLIYFRDKHEFRPSIQWE